MFDDIFVYEKIIEERPFLYDSKGNKFYVGSKLGLNYDPKPDIECIHIANDVATFRWISDPDAHYRQDQEHITKETAWVVYNV